MHNLTLTEEQAMILDTVRKFVQDVVEPQALEHDENVEFVRAGFDGLAELGLFGAAIPEDAGGAGLGILSLVVSLEELGKVCGSTGRLFLSQAGICAQALVGLEAAAETLAALAMGEAVGAFVGPEHGVTADASGDGFTLRGVADYVTAAAEAGVLVVCARSGDEALLLRVDPGVVKIAAIPALGYRASAPGRVELDAVSVGGDAVLARGADADAAVARAVFAAQVGGAALAVGSALAAVELGRRHSEERIAFGKPLARQQAVGHKLIESRRRAEAARHLVFHAARLADLGEDATEAGFLARLTAVDSALYAADESIQVHGGFGYTAEYHVERHYRDAKTLEVLDGGALRLRDALAARMAALA